MIRFLFRLVFRAVALIALASIALVAYYLYDTGQLPWVERAVRDTAVDGAVTAAVKIHRDLGNRDIEVTSESGVVTLRGRVASEEERNELLDLASNIEGVESVVDELAIDPDAANDVREASSRSLGQRLDDTALLTKVRAALHLDRTTREVELDIRVTDGTVLLEGAVESEEIAERVRSRVASVSGVSSVEDRLERPDKQ